MLSSRSGGWIFPNYMFGYPVDLYSSRAFLCLPWRIGSWFTETLLTWVQGNPKRYPSATKIKLLGISIHVVKTHHANFWDALRVSHAAEIGNSDRNSKLGLICFDHLTMVD